METAEHQDRFVRLQAAFANGDSLQMSDTVLNGVGSNAGGFVSLSRGVRFGVAGTEASAGIWNGDCAEALFCAGGGTGVGAGAGAVSRRGAGESVGFGVAVAGRDFDL